MTMTKGKLVVSFLYLKSNMLTLEHSNSGDGPRKSDPNLKESEGPSPVPPNLKKIEGPSPVSHTQCNSGTKIFDHFVNIKDNSKGKENISYASYFSIQKVTAADTLGRRRAGRMHTTMGTTNHLSEKEMSSSLQRQPSLERKENFED
jgi:hypothetical protein